MATRGGKKGRLDLVSDKNDLIQQLKDSEYIKNPLVYSQIRGDFSLIQTSVLVAIAATMQERINARFGPDGRLGEIFSPQELSRGKITFEVPLSALGVSTKEYAAVHEACKALTKLDTTYAYTEYDEQGRRVGDRVRTSVIFTDVDVPTYTTSTGQRRRQGVIKIDMNASVAEQIFNKSGAYVTHLGGIVRLCRSPRTPRLYIYLSAWKARRTCTFNYVALKEFLGVLSYSRGRDRVLRDKCATWAVFHRDVLDPASRELRRLSEQGKVEFHFDYKPVYRGPKRRGNPDGVRFDLHPSPARPPADWPGAGEPPAPAAGADAPSPAEPDPRWERFVELAGERCGQEFRDVFLTPCSLRQATADSVVVDVPTTYVAQQWEARGEPLFDCVRQAFGPRVRLCYKIPPRR